MFKNDSVKLRAFPYSQQGNTLLELLLVVTILCLSFFAAIPNLNKYLTSTEQEIALDRIKNAIEFAKNEAFRKNKTISLCPSHTQNSCTYGDGWDVGFILFENDNKNSQPTPESLLKVFEGTRYGKIVFDAMGNQLNIQANGTTTNIGNFVYCAKIKNLIKPKGLVLNWVARIYSTEENPIKSIESKCW